MKKKFSVLIISASAGMAICFIFFKRDKITGVADTYREVKQLHHGASALTRNGKTPDLEKLKPVAPWDYHRPLSSDEKQEFQVVEAQVHKFLTWGKMDADAVPTFRQTLFKLGDRAVADLARGLSQLTREDLQDRAAAESVVQKIDEMAYFANSSNPLAADCIAAIARRSVDWNEAGELLSPVEANITFELFDIYARIRPAEAAEFIKGIDKKNRTAYFTHYAYGRKLAGKTLEEIDLELRAVFGSPELALK